MISDNFEGTSLRVAIVHYWFLGRAGGEKVVEAVAEVFPQADLFALVADPSTLSPVLRGHKLRTSFLQKVPGSKKFHRHFLPIQPMALEQFDLSGYDLVISSESGPAKGVITSPKTCHVCYCHSPMRYLWDMRNEYRESMNALVSSVFSLAAHYLRVWDLASADRVDYFVANSKFIAGRIRKYYGRESTVIYPPVDVSAGRIARKKEDYYIAIGRLVPYKRFDQAVAACTKLGRRLLVIGDGPARKRLRSMAGPSVKFLGQTSDAELHTYLASSRALLFPGAEDFGMVPVEAQSFGKPVIAYASGGALETINASLPGEPEIDNPTGVFFTEGSTEGLIDGIRRFEVMETAGIFCSENIRRQAAQFDKAIFQQRIREYAVSALEIFRAAGETRPARLLEAS